MIDHLPCSIKMSDNPVRDERITEASSYEEVHKCGSELGISEKSESEEISEELKSVDNAESETSEDNCVEENDDDNKSEESDEDTPESCCQCCLNIFNCQD